MVRRVNVTWLAACTCVLAAGLSCPSETVRRTPQPRRSDPAFVIFLTGSELGSLRPCGCSGGQLGGLEKRSAIFNIVPPSRRLIVETGSLVEKDRAQDLIKFRIFFESFKLLGYDVVHLTDRDCEIATHLGLLADSSQEYAIIHTAGRNPSAVFTRRMGAPGRELTVNVASVDLQELPAGAAAGVFPEVSDAAAVDILILPRCDLNALKSLTQRVPGVECIICPSDSDEPQLLSDPGSTPVILTVGRWGRYVGRLGVSFSDRTGDPVLRFESIPVAAELPDDEALVQLYRQYQQLVGQSNLLEEYPRVPLPGKGAFAGSAACRRCHDFEYDKWSTKAHAHAFATLRKVGSDRDPECVICHVVGMEYESGFVTEEKTPHLTDVGCETCHGPGAEHVLTAGQTPPGQPQTACAQCHTPERSAGFAGHEEEYQQKIVHWREPTAAGNVKN